MWVPWQAQTIFTWVALYLYVTPEIALPLGPGPVVETHGKFGKEPDPPNLTSAAMPGLMDGYSEGKLFACLFASSCAREVLCSPDGRLVCPLNCSDGHESGRRAPDKLGLVTCGGTEVGMALPA
uniref:Uncharacterized protein n=1 Tax=Opuntia streptacantha TaxID=393608 RepID=A0A7C9AWU5_OPUST